MIDSGALAPGGWVAVEHAANEPPAPEGDLTVVQERRHGRTGITLLARGAGA